MASIGELNATLTADTASFTKGMGDAQTALAGVAKATETTTNDLTLLQGQLASAEGRLTQLRGAFASLGIQPVGREFQEAEQKVAALKQQVVQATSAMQQAARVTPQVAAGLTTAKTASTGFADGLNKIRGPLTNISASLAGVPGPVGNLASKLLGFAVGGPVTIAVTAGLAALALGFQKLREKAVQESERVEQSVQGLVEGYRSRTGAVIRQGLEDAKTELAAAQRVLEEAQAQVDRGPKPVVRSLVGGVGERDVEALTEAKAEVDRLNQAVQEATERLQEFNKPKTDALKAAVAQARELRDLLAQSEQRFLDFGAAVRSSGLDAVADQQAALTAQMAQAGQESRNAREAALERIRDTVTFDQQDLQVITDITNQLLEQVGIRSELSGKALEGLKADDTVKQALNEAAQQSQEVAEAAGRGMARAIGNGFTSGKGNLIQALTSTLSEALRSAVEKVLAMKITDALLKAFSPDKGLVSGGLVSDIGSVIGGIFGAPQMPDLPSGVGNLPPTTVLVPVSGLPRALTPIEQARDAQWMELMGETFRVARDYGYRLETV